MKTTYQMNGTVAVEMGDAFGLVYSVLGAWSYYVTGEHVADSPYYGVTYATKDDAVAACKDDVRHCA